MEKQAGVRDTLAKELRHRQPGVPGRSEVTRCCRRNSETA